MIEALGGTTRLAELGLQTLEDGTQLPLPPVLLGQIGDDPQKKTVLLYGHLDVQPAKKVLANFLLVRSNLYWSHFVIVLR